MTSVWPPPFAKINCPVRHLKLKSFIINKLCKTYLFFYFFKVFDNFILVFKFIVVANVSGHKRGWSCFFLFAMHCPWWGTRSNQLGPRESYFIPHFSEQYNVMRGIKTMCPNRSKDLFPKIAKMIQRWKLSLLEGSKDKRWRLSKDSRPPDTIKKGEIDRLSFDIWIWYYSYKPILVTRAAKCNHKSSYLFFPFLCHRNVHPL